MSVQNIGNGRWRVTAKLGTNPVTGEVEYFDTTLKGTKQEAKNLEAEKTLFHRGKLSGMTLQSFMESKWMPSLEVSSNTLDYYEGTARRHIYPRIGHIVLRDLDVPTLEAFFAELPQNSVRTCVKKTLSAALSQAARWSLIQANPISLLRVSKPSKTRRRAYKTFTPEECKKLQQIITGTVIEALVLVMLNSGARREEACALDWEDFYWDDCTVDIQKAYIVRSSTGSCEMKEPKNDDSYRTLFFDGYAADRLYELSIGNSGPICKAKSGERMRPDYAATLFRSLCVAFGLPDDVPLNHLRHTFATQHIEAGTDVATLKSLMGHSSISTIIDNYLLPREEARRRSQRNLSARISPITEPSQSKTRVK